MLSKQSKPGSVSMNDAEQVQPSSRYYLLAIFFVAAGVGLMIYFLVSDTCIASESR
jgi:hypothetical protein